jgi:peptide/nickel transport system ATP-binding protein
MTLSVRGLGVSFGDARAVDGVSLDVERGETVCLVGESGAGKTTLCEALLGLSGGRIEGEVRLDGESVLDDPGAVRGERIGFVFQDAAGSLNPVLPVRAAVAEPLRARGVGRSLARERADGLLERVGAAGLGDAYPHELSGGEARRVALAAALAGDPGFLVLDEPTAGLDAPAKRGLLSLLDGLDGVGCLLVTHDLGTVAAVGDRGLVLYAGGAVERAPVTDLFERPAHPYTRALLDALPGEGPPTPIPGEPPAPEDLPAGCRFHPRCPAATEECRTGERPPLYDADGREASCVYYGPGYDPADLER